jgi:hypothetical protein
MWTRTYNDPNLEAQELLGHKDCHKMDIQYQENFFAKDLGLMALLPNRDYAIELCAGKARVTRELLSYIFKNIDVHDQVDLGKTWDEINSELKQKRSKRTMS